MYRQGLGLPVLVSVGAGLAYLMIFSDIFSAYFWNNFGSLQNLLFNPAKCFSARLRPSDFNAESSLHKIPTEKFLSSFFNVLFKMYSVHLSSCVKEGLFPNFSLSSKSRAKILRICSQDWSSSRITFTKLTISLYGIYMEFTGFWIPDKNVLG